MPILEKRVLNVGYIVNLLYKYAQVKFLIESPRLCKFGLNHSPNQSK